MDLSGLDLDLGNNDFFGELDDKGLESRKKSAKTRSTSGGSATQKLNSISEKAMQALKQDDILPLPENFEEYFQKALSQEEDEHIREKIKALLEHGNRDTRVAELEHTFNNNFAMLKTILEQVLTLCKQMVAMEDNTQKRLTEIAEINNPLGAQNAIKVLINEIKGFHKQFVTQANLISHSYRRMHEKSSNTRQNTIYDTTLGAHSKSFFMQSLELERENGKDFPRNCALVVFAPSKELGAQLIDQNKLMAVFKNIAKVVASSIGTKDLVAYLGGGRFGMLLKNVQPNQAAKLCEEAIKKCKATSIFIGDSEIYLSVVMGGIAFNISKSLDTMIEEAKTMLDKAYANNKTLEFDSASSSSSSSSESFDIPGDDLGDLGDFNLS